MRDRRGKVVAAAGISFNPARFRKRDALDLHLPQLRQAAEQIALNLVGNSLKFVANEMPAKETTRV